MTSAQAAHLTLGGFLETRWVKAFWVFLVVNMLEVVYIAGKSWGTFAHGDWQYAESFIMASACSPEACCATSAIAAIAKRSRRIPVSSQ